MDDESLHKQMTTRAVEMRERFSEQAVVQKRE
jgi:hypothetical protein